MNPLAGFRVLDFTSMVSGPFAGAILAEQGAEVIKIEPPQGEQMRRGGSAQNGIPAIYYSCNRGKKSLCIDLKQSAGIDVILDLFEKADVVLQNFRPGVVDRMGIGYEAAKARNPKVVYVSISGFGQQGPYAHQRVYDPVIQALSGATDIQADRISQEPAMMRTVVADKVTSLTAAQAISAALLQRERMGAGQHIDISMLDATLAFFWPGAMSNFTFAEKESDPKQNQWSKDLIFATKDGYITAGAISESEWQGLCRALGREHLLTDPRFETPQVRAQHAEDRLQEMTDAIAEFESAEILARLDEHQVPSAPVLSRAELLSHEQLNANQSIQFHDIEGFGEVRQATPAARFGNEPTQVSAPAPQLGEHSQDLLASMGYEADNIQKLIDSGTVRTAN